MKRKTSSKLKSHVARKAWELLRAGDNYKSIGEVVGYTSTAIKDYANKKFKMEATKLWSAQIRAVGGCEICGSSDSLNAHHLLSKSVWPHLRYDLSNGVCLCAGHHTMDREICPHGSLPAMEAFVEWLAIERAGVFVWYGEHKLDQKYQDVDYELEYRRLLEIGEL